MIGVPKTIDGDLKSEKVECSFGFDTATKVYSELIANLAIDATSAKKTYHVVRLMGRNASHISLECALQTHPNIALIGGKRRTGHAHMNGSRSYHDAEEVYDKKQTLAQVTTFVADAVCKRAESGKNFGVIVIPEGLVDFMPDVRTHAFFVHAQLLVRADTFAGKQADCGVE